MSNSTLFMMPSGGFVATQGYQMGQTSAESASIWNPALADQFRESYKFTAYEQLWDSVGKCLSLEYPKVSQADFDQYGETLVTLAQNVAAEEAADPTIIVTGRAASDEAEERATKTPGGTDIVSGNRKLLLGARAGAA